MVDEIPVGELTTSEPARIGHDDVCGSIPPAALAKLGYRAPHDRWFTFCQWLDKSQGHHHFVNIGYDERPLFASVDEVRPTMRSHLRWLRIDGSYPFEDILDYDPMQSCRVTADYGAAETLLVTTYTGLETATDEAVEQLCAKSRLVTQIVLRHLPP